ncbi:hypothetical protein LTS15_006204 [Exophiala xenobiotica]|nr:hypothetical protein LTS15_006204 [Exophiala xenobiotica]
MTSTSNTPYATPGTSTPTTRPGTPSQQPTPTTVPADNQLQDDSSKLRTFLSLLRKYAQSTWGTGKEIGVDNWQNTGTISIDRKPSQDDDVGRMLEVLRFWFTKDLKYVKGKPCKPYNSTLGEFFRCTWEVTEPAPSISRPSKAPPQPPADPTKQNAEKPVRISFLTEQTSHHPPVSAYWYACPERGIQARGYDQISAKFTGTSVRVVPGMFNRGIFITLTHRDNEEYQLNHPAASLGGLLRGSLYISVADTCAVTCPKTRLKCLLTYVEESWFGKAQNRVHGIIFRYDPNDDKYTRIKDVPDKDVLVKIEGCWQEQITYTIPKTAAVKEHDGLEPTSDKQLLIDLQPLMPVPKIAPPPEEQLPNESRQFWKDVTTAIAEKRFNDATRIKQDLEQAQRDKAARRTQVNAEFKPRFFTSVTEPNGKPELTEYGKGVLQGMDQKAYQIEHLPEPGVDV